MAATVQIRRWTGATSGPTKTDITSQTNRAATADDPAPGTNNPIPVPTGGTPNYSYWVCTRLSTSAGASTSINNIKWYTDSSNSMGTGVTLNVAIASTTGAASGYRQAIGSTGVSGSQLTTANYAALTAATSDAFTYTSGSPLSVAGSIGTGTSDFGEFVVYQVAVASTASPGATTAEQVTWQYDET